MSTGLLPPSSRMTGVSQWLAFSITSLPTVTPPVKKMKSKRWSKRAEFSLRPPSTTVTQPGSKVSAMSFAMAALVAGA